VSGWGFKRSNSQRCCVEINGESGVGTWGTGEAGRERRGGPKVLLEGAPLKAASRQEGREGLLGLPKMSVS